MTFYLTDDPEAPPANPAPAENSSLLDVAGAAWDDETISTDAWRQTDRVRREVLDDVRKRVGTFGQDMPVAPAPDVTELGVGAEYQSYATEGTRSKREEEQLLARAREAAKADPTSFGGTPLDSDQVEAEVNRRLRAEQADARAVLATGGTGSGVAEFAVRSARAATDEFGLAFMLAGAGEGKIAWTLAREGALGAAGEAFVLPRQYEMAERLGIPDPSALDQIALAAIGSAGLAGVSAAAIRGFRYALGRTVEEAGARPAGADATDAHAALNDAEGALSTGAALNPPPSIGADDASLDTIAGKIIGIESGGRAGSQSETSSAGGLGGFIDSTWLATIKRHRPDLAATRSDAQLLALKTDPALGREMTIAHTRENRAALAAEGLPTDAGSVYLAHFAGVGSAKRILRGDPNAPVSAVLSPQAIAANRNIRYGGRFLENMTLSDLRRWAEVKMGQAVDPGGAYQVSTRAGYTMPDEIVTPGGARVGVAYEVVDARDLVPASGELQPRDRSRAASAEQIGEMAARLDPARLMPGPESDRGAPVIGPDNVIESGNGRVQAILQAAQRFPDRYQAYVEAVRQVADVPEGMETPVLVARRTTDLDAGARAAFVRESNQSGIARMSATEQAGMDARAVSEAALELHSPDAPLTSPENRAFVAEVLRGLPQAERAALYGPDGRPNAEGLRRIRQALFARAFDAPDLTRQVAELEGAGLRGMAEALSDVAPAWARLRDEIAAGRIDPELDATDQMLDAVRLIATARETAAASGGKVSVRGAIDDALAQGDLIAGELDKVTRRFVDVFYRGDRPRSAADVARILNTYVDEALRVGSTERSLFADLPNPTPAEILDALKRQDGEAAGGPGTRPGTDARRPEDGGPGADDRGSGSGGGRGDAGEPAADRAEDGGQASLDFSELGPVFTGYEGDPQGAIARLMQEKTGQVPGVLHHPGVSDPIDLVWGEAGTGPNSGFGLAKIADRHPEVLDDLQGRLEAAEVTSRSANRIRLRSATDDFAIALNYKGDTKTWLLTAFERRPNWKEKQGVERSMIRPDSRPETASASALPDPKDSAEGAVLQPPDIRLADDAAFAAGAHDTALAAATLRQLSDMRRAIETGGDFDVPDGNGGTLKASDLLRELDDDQEIADVISACTLSGRPGGAGDA